jgi:hypothetical protein
MIVPLLERVPSRAGYVLAWLLAASNLIGCVNVARHWDTNKGSWNLPVAETVAAARTAASRCGSATPVIAVLDPVLAGNLAERTPYVVIGAHPPAIPDSMLRDGDYCLFQIKTFHGSIPHRNYARIQAGFPAPAGPAVRIGVDPNAAIKRWHNSEVPDYYVELQPYGRVRRVPDFLRLAEKRTRGMSVGTERGAADD